MSVSDPTATESRLDVKERLINCAAPGLALIYPWLVSLGPTLHPALLLAALAVPAVAFWLFHNRLDSVRHLTARRIALVAVAAPAIFSFLGGWLDGQQLLPFKGRGAWIIIWVLLGVMAAAGRPTRTTFRRDDGRPTGNRRLRIAHGISAALILMFAFFHLINHLVGLGGGRAHWEVMQALRQAYRAPPVEVLLLACIAFQVVSGSLLLWRAAIFKTSWIRSLQLASAGYLLWFFASHLSAVLRARHMRGTDTNWEWLTSSPLLTDSWSARLVPYYWLGVIALGVHAAAGLRQVLVAHGVAEPKANVGFFGAIAVAILVSSLIMAGLVAGSQ